MIILQTANKDTFVTDMITSFNKGVDANFGQASTVDLFKIAGENKNIKSRSLMTILENITDGDVFKITDYKNIEKTFEFNTSNIAGSITVSDTDSIINSVNSTADLGIDAYKIEDNKILLQQQKTGVSGDTIPYVSNNNTSIIITNFVRFEHSAILLSYDLKSFKENHLNDIDNSVYINSAGEADFKAIIKLSDVSSGTTYPKDFKVKLRVLKTDFNEGIGKDILHFSDYGDANFKTLDYDKNISWDVEGFITKNDLYQEGFEKTITIEKGNENIYFDITDYVLEYLKSDLSDSMPSSFVINIDNENLFDKYTYFIKKLGSRNLSNKYLRPQLEIRIPDFKFENISYNNKKRFLDNDEVFYISNLVNKKSQEFPQNTECRLSIEFKDTFIEKTNITFLKIPDHDTYISITDELNNTVNYGFNDTGNDIFDSSGNLIVTAANIINTSIKNTINLLIEDFKNKIDIGNQGNVLAEANTSYLTLSYNNNYSQVNFVKVENDNKNFVSIKNISTVRNIFDFPDDGILGESVYDYKGNLLPGIIKFKIQNDKISRFNNSILFQNKLKQFKKASLDFNFNLIKNNTKYLMQNESIDFYLPEVREEDLFKKVYVSLDTQQKIISADDSVKSLMFSFIDIRRQYDAVNTSIDIISEDLGDISYQMYNVDTGRILLDDNENNTNLFFNGKHYIMNLYSSTIFKNLRVCFIFKYKDNLTGLTKKIHDKSLILRFE